MNKQDRNNCTAVEVTVRWGPGVEVGDQVAEVGEVDARLEDARRQRDAGGMIDPVAYMALVEAGEMVRPGRRGGRDDG